MGQERESEKPDEQRGDEIVLDDDEEAALDRVWAERDRRAKQSTPSPRRSGR